MRHEKKKKIFEGERKGRIRGSSNRREEKQIRRGGGVEERKTKMEKKNGKK